MAAQVGEENVATLFGDIHYFYGPASIVPRHHRFDKGSYVYLFENASERRCRLEIANHPGSDIQDAFEGYLDQAHVRYSYKQHCMVSLTVADSVDRLEWHLPTYDPRNEKKYHYKLTALDIYFWTQQDALQFVSGVRRVLPPTQVEIFDEPGLSQAADIQTVVRKLERAAIAHELYRVNVPSPKTLTHECNPDETSAASIDLSSNLQAVPPPPPPPHTNLLAMPYNPAAPAAPETIIYREKTPPPEEYSLNPLAVAVAHDYQGQPFTPAVATQSQFPLGLASPMRSSNGIGGSSVLQPLRPVGTPGVVTGPVADLASPALSSPNSTKFPGPPRPFAASASTSTLPLSQPSLQTKHHVLANGTAVQSPHGGFTECAHVHDNPSLCSASDYSFHQQLYRPSEVDISHSEHRSQSKTQVMGRLEQNAGRLERGVSGMLKKFEKKFG